MIKNKDAVNILVEHACGFSIENIPDATLAKSVELFQDTIACILAGSSADGIKAIKDSVMLWGGHEQATVFGFSEKTSVPFAALVNSAMAHARDFDDTHDKAVNHGCVTTVPALLALAEFISSPQAGKLYRKISGLEFVGALTIGLDIANRLGTAFISYLHTGWLPTTLWGPFGCAAACGRLLQLNEEQMRNAFGLAYAQIHGNRQALIDGALAKRLQPGFSASAGIQSAFLAMNGITAAQNILEGNFGVSTLYAGSNIDIDCIEKDLGTCFEVDNISIKPYPSCRCTHAVIDAAMELKQRYNISWNDIVSGEILLPPMSMGQIGNEFKIRDNPTVDAQFSAQYTAALTFIKGKPVLKDFEPETVSSARDVISLASMFKPIEYRKNTPGIVPVELAVKLKNGRELRACISVPLGSPSNAMSRKEMEFKFNDCLDSSRKVYSPAQRKDLTDCLTGLLELDDISELFTRI
jgi:2-methylcitrate dehydratase PrpD